MQQLMQRVRRIEIKTRALSDNVFAGQYHSAFKGRGMSFAESANTNPAMMFATLIGTSQHALTAPM